MNLVELYKQTPVERHADIKVVGDRVFVKDEDGDHDDPLPEHVADRDDGRQPAA